MILLLFGVIMKFKDFLLNEDRSDNSGATIKDALDAIGAGLETVRQTITKENTSTANYKEDGHDVKALWLLEDGPMEDEGYSLKDGENKLKNLVDSFKKQGGEIIKLGTTKENSKTVIEFDGEFKLTIIPLVLNSAIDGSGFDRTFLISDLTLLFKL